MWQTSNGTRTLQDAEAELFRQMLGYLVYEIDVTCRQAEIPFEIGISVFDCLQAGQQLTLVTEVGEALLIPDMEAPELTAVREATVAAVYEQLSICIEMEIENQELNGYEIDCWRGLARQAYVESGDDSDDEYEPPPSNSTDLDEWQMLTDCLADQILWDRDFDMEDQFVDAAPDEAQRLRNYLGISEEYFLDIAPDPDDREVILVRTRLNRLILSEL